jgi:hypothetical protein
MPYSRVSRCVALVRTDLSEERMVSIVRVTRIGELGTTSAGNRSTLRRNLRSMLPYLIANFVPSLPILVTGMVEVICFSETLGLTDPHDIPSQKTPFLISAS